MNNSDFISTIDQAFQGMVERKEESVIVRSFDNIKEITLPSEQKIPVNRVTVSMVRKSGQNIIKVLYLEGTYEPLMFMTPKDKESALVMLFSNNILPSKEEWIEAKSLANTLGVADFFGCE